MRDSMEPGRLKRIRDLVAGTPAGDVGGGRRFEIRYEVPWFRSRMPRDAVDMIFSQEVMEHVGHLSDVYKMMASLLKPGGYASHRINFASHDPASKNWNDHWTIGDVAWRMRWDRLIWMINRVPLSGHVDLMRRHGFRIVSMTRHKDSKGSVR